MKKILLLTIFMVSMISSAQIKLTGIVKDSIGSPLEMANILAINKKTKAMASYGFTDSKGRYKLDLGKNASFDIKISYIGMKTLDFVVETKTVDITKNVTLKEDNSLDEITIVSKMPVTIKGDTIVYNADSFKNGSERKLEDVLKKLPGVEINDAGEIEVEGKKVEKIMVDGKDFFDGDSKLASKNIPSNAVDKIQVLRNFSDVNQLRGVQNNQDRVALNIKLKDGKKNFWFGDVTAGAGKAPGEGLYLFQPKLFYYTPKYTINVIGDLNNIGDVVLNRSDIRNFSGGFRSQSPSNGTNINLGSAGIGFLNANARNANKIVTKLSALNFSYSPNKKLDLSGFLIWSSNNNGQRNINDVDYLDNSIPDDRTDNSTDQTSNTGLLKLSAIYKKNFNNQLNYDVIGRFSNEYRTDNVSSIVVGNNIVEDENATPYKINQNLSYFYTANENNIFALEVQHLLQDEDPFYVASLENDPNSNTDGFDGVATQLGLDTSVNQYLIEQDRRVKSNQLDAKLDYYYIINQKSNFNFVAGTILSTQNFDSRFFQILDNGTTLDPIPTIPNNPNPSTINNTDYNFSDIYAGMRYRLKSGIFTFTPGFTAHAYNVNNTQFGTQLFEDSFQKFLPEFDMIMQFKKSESLQFTYRQNVNFTDVNQIAEGIVASNYKSFFFGNEDLMNAHSHNVSLNYRSFNLFNYTNVFARISYNKTIDQIVSVADFVPGSVISTRSNLNLPFDTENFSAFGNISKTVKKIRFGLFSRYSYNKNYQLFGAITNEIKSNVYTFRPSIGTNFNKAPNISLRYSVTYNDQSTLNLTSNTLRDVNTFTNAPSISFDAYIWNSLTVRTDFAYTENSQAGVHLNSFKIWNAKFAYRKDRDAKWEYELEGSNLLSTGSRATVNFGNISNSINETFILPRLITFRVRYQI